ncbi:MAG: PD-(D/E)XK nuclease family protein, partial [Candidatus ainarchaeum sp.]|nr:PD-(D/E)XK nuclease family protein [Candidatus ainarchaeum sp.]
ILKNILSDYEKEELEEEDLRSDFVAMTRAKKELYIITKKLADYTNQKSETENINTEVTLEEKFIEKQKLAYNLFVNKEYDKAKQLLETNKKWLEAYIKDYFKNMKTISFSTVQKDAYEFLTKRIIKLNDFGSAINIGLTVHKKIEEYLKGNEQEITLEEKPFYENAMKIINDIEKEGYKLIKAEYEIKMPLNKITKTESDIEFTGFIDAVYKTNDELLIIDWKTNRNEDSGSKHRQQLALYKKALSVLENTHEEKIKIALAYIGLRPNINNGTINSHYNNLQPQKTAIETITKEINQIIDWKNNPSLFIEELKKSTKEGMLIRAIKEELN